MPGGASFDGRIGGLHAILPRYTDSKNFRFLDCFKRARSFVLVGPGGRRVEVEQSEHSWFLSVVHRNT